MPYAPPEQPKPDPEHGIDFRQSKEIRLDRDSNGMTLDSTVTELMIRMKNYALARQWSDFSIDISIFMLDALRLQVTAQVRSNDHE